VLFRPPGLPVWSLGNELLVPLPANRNTSGLVTLLLAAGTLLLLAVLMSTILGAANKAFHVPVDVRIEKVNAVLPGANCGGCDRVGCNEYAEAVVNEGEEPDKCPVGGSDVASKVASRALGHDNLNFSARYIDALGITPETRYAVRFRRRQTWSTRG
jgi:Na+-translocating ferredoxin:NAD+ oxidoreductase RNF subunit RnfB